MPASASPPDRPPDPGTPTLDQLHVLVTVVEQGSFAAAARMLNRATSVISYTISNLEAQLGIALFDREATRRPRLTAAGRAVLAEARSVTAGVGNLRATVRGLMQGLEAELHLVVDSLMPSDRLVDALLAFRDRFPTVPLHLHVEALGAVTQLVLDRTAMIGIGGPLLAGYDEIDQVGVGTIVLVPVAAPFHPLAINGPNPVGAGREHVQLVITDRSELTRGRDFGVFAARTWRLGDLGAKHTLLRAGMGWGTMPLPMVEDDLEHGRLVRLQMPEIDAIEYRLQAIHRRDAPPGPAGRWLIDHLRGDSEKLGSDLPI